MNTFMSPASSSYRLPIPLGSLRLASNVCSSTKVAWPFPNHEKISLLNGSITLILWLYVSVTAITFFSGINETPRGCYNLATSY